MPKIADILTMKQVAELARKEGTWPISPRLYLQSAGGSTSMIFRYKSPSTGKGRSMGLGAFDTTKHNAASILDDFRAEVERLKALVKDHIDPLENRAQEKKMATARATGRINETITFKQVTDAFIAAHEAKWSTANRNQWAASLEKHAHPVLGKLPVADIKRADIEKVIAPIWHTKTITATRVLNRIEQVLGYAKAKDLRTGDNPAVWKEGFKHLLPAPGKIHKVEHLKSLPCAEVPALMVMLAERPLIRARALEFLVLTVARTSTVLGARWDDIDFAAATWTVAKMKNGRPWTCPLSPQALALLVSIKPANTQGNDHIFAGTIIGQPVGTHQPAKELQLVGIPKEVATPHGFRASFNEFCSKRLAEPRLVDYCLAHFEGSATKRAYDRDPLIEQRRPLMADWANHCLPQSNVVPFDQARAG